VSKLNHVGYKLEIAHIFKHLTINKISPYVEKKIQEIDQDPVEGIIRLSPIQKWFMQRNLTGKHHWNLAFMLYKEEGFETEILKKVLDQLVRHHDILRAALTPGEEAMINRGPGGSEPGDNPHYTLDVIDLTTQPADMLENKINNETERIQGSIDLYNGPLMKTGVFETPQGDHLLIVIHHLVIDGVSWRILFEDLADGYRQAKEAQSRDAEIEITLPKKTHSFKHWAEKLTEYHRSPRLLKQADYWKKICTRGTTALTPEPPVKKGTLAEYYRTRIEIEEKESGILFNEANKAYNTEINDLLLSALGATLNETFGMENPLVFSKTSHRHDRPMSDAELLARCDNICMESPGC
ncbi:MAG: hypothetical protein GY757_45120, partial [bacterium]|nr:hypothetical protein [bacterium]